jgi:predicted nucleotide-binding protein
MRAPAKGQKMGITRRVFVSVPADAFNSRRQNAFKWKLVDFIEKQGLFPEIFFNPRKTEGLAAPVSWTPDALESVMRQCCGAVLIGLPRWRFPGPKGETLMATEYCHYEGALARSLGLPLLVLVHEGTMKRGVFDSSFGAFITVFPDDVDGSWIKSQTCAIAIKKWMAQVEKRRDVFLGYCGSSARLARKIKSFIVRSTGATVLDWQTDFAMGRTILDQISEAGRRCNAGIFIFTKDDMVSEAEVKRRLRSRKRIAQSQELAIPRDNVVFEAGYFMSLKGPGRVLIVREEGTKMPADLGGQIYTALQDRSDITLIKNDLLRFIDKL